MKTITIYELLGMIKDNKVLPKKIKFHNCTYRLDNNEYNSDYYNEITNRWLFFDRWALTNNLNEEVEIIEEEKRLKKIEKLNNVGNSQDLGEFKDKQQLNNHILKDKINEIINIINEMKEGKEWTN